MPTSDDILDPKFGSVPFYSCANTDQRNLIPARCRRVGMLVYTFEDPNYWQLLSQPWNMTDSDWTAFCPCSAQANPAFTAFAIQGQATPLEVGDSVAGGSRTFTWSTSNSPSVKPNSIEVDDTTGSVVLATGLANTGSYAITISTITEILPATYTWTIKGTSTQNNVFSRTFSVVWEWRVYAGTNAATPLTSNQIKALSDSDALQADFAGTYSYADPGTPSYYYFCFPASMGTPASFTDANTGFPVDITLLSPVSVTNAHGVATSYTVYRTTNNFQGAFVMRVN